MLHDELLQEDLPQASHFFHRFMFSVFLVLDHHLCSHNHHENYYPTVNSPQISLKALWISVGFLLHKVSTPDLKYSQYLTHLQAPFLALVKYRVHNLHENRYPTRNCTTVHCEVTINFTENTWISVEFFRVKFRS